MSAGERWRRIGTDREGIEVGRREREVRAAGIVLAETLVRWCELDPEWPFPAPPVWVPLNELVFVPPRHHGTPT